jgi:hypothetical protein
MKFIGQVILAFILAIGGLHLTSCANVFTKRDAIDAGAMLARASLDIAAQKAAGQKVDIKAAGQQLGFQLVSQISTNAQANLLAEDKPLAAATVLAAGEAAKLLITETPFDSPEARLTALRVATVAVSAAAEHFNGPLAAPSGK